MIWTAAASGSTAVVSAEGESVVQFRAVDAAGNVSLWAPATPTPGSTIRLDRTPPTAPGSTGGSFVWQNLSQMTLTGGGAADTLSGVASYQYRTSGDGGASWTSATDGSSVIITAEGETLAQFRAIDGAGNVGAWAPAAGTALATARLDRTPPTDPRSAAAPSRGRAWPR